MLKLCEYAAFINDKDPTWLNENIDTLINAAKCNI